MLRSGTGSNSRLLKTAAGLLLLLVVASAGCSGGGTDGTGLKTFSGNLSNSAGSPLSDVLIAILETGDQGVTDASGLFFLESFTDLESVTFTFNNTGAPNASAVVSELPSGDAQIQISFVLRDDNSVEVTSQETIPQDDVIRRTATPTPPQSGAPNSATATPSPAPIPEISPQPSNIPSSQTPSPTAGPSVTPTHFAEFTSAPEPEDPAPPTASATPTRRLTSVPFPD